MAAAEFTSRDENLIDIGTDQYVIIALPGEILHVYRNGLVTSENSGREFRFSGSRRRETPVAADIRKDPRFLEATRLFDMWNWGWGMPSDPHAKESLRHACGRLATGEEKASGFLEVVLSRYLGEKYRDTARTELQRIAQGAGKAAKDQGEGKGK